MNSRRPPTVVRTDIAGSYVVVDLGWGEYIDARKDVRTPEHSHVELVSYGQVRSRVIVRNTHAPEYIGDLMRMAY